MVQVLLTEESDGPEGGAAAEDPEDFAEEQTPPLPTPARHPAPIGPARPQPAQPRGFGFVLISCCKDGGRLGGARIGERGREDVGPGGREKKGEERKGMNVQFR